MATVGESGQRHLSPWRGTSAGAEERVVAGGALRVLQLRGAQHCLGTTALRFCCSSARGLPVQFFALLSARIV